MWGIKYMKNKIAKGEINPRPLFRKSLFFSFLKEKITMAFLLHQKMYALNTFLVQEFFYVVF
jgi:hypothetical protein